ncbi:hypothetical protein MCOR25_005793 [Pyricularia grisea]|uniref:Flavoprotein domain-containing protein n=1 Tax=Pyricularia grisea TaxID=148305 RepID=A0A6P8BGB2_PYRGI|nr:uncharacterized protein PgNI_01591 [Pyricularia grisea]KAI6363727.1 hypothetical protein MCOR25_005793 [Pyricularia grisea]TLD15906.1 hypothetical protein PgNI_01591 [Pyricularia grisea]
MVRTQQPQQQDATAVSALSASISDGKKHLLLSASGSVATIKLPNILRALGEAHDPSRLSIRVVLTHSAEHFLAGQAEEQPTLEAIRAIPCVDAVYGDADEWGPRPWKRGEGILHIELRKWADMLVIAPLSANTLAKITNGICNNLLTSVVRAWDTDGVVEGRGKRIIVCPAMNTAMWRHPITAKQIRTLEKDWGAGSTQGEGDGGWFEVMPPQEMKLACGDVGVGGMVDWKQVVKAIELRLDLSQDQLGQPT